MDTNLNLIEVDDEASQLISQAASSILAQAGAENLDPVSFSQQYTPAAVASAMDIVAALAAFLADVNAVGNLTKTVHFVTNGQRREQMFVHVASADGTVYTNASGEALDYTLFTDADYLIVGPKLLDPAQHTVVRNNIRIHLATSAVAGTPGNVIFKVTGSEYAIFDGYSITNCMKLNSVSQLQVN